MYLPQQPLLAFSCVYFFQHHWPLSETQQRGTAFTGVFLKLERNRKDVINKLNKELKEQLKNIQQRRCAILCGPQSRLIIPR